MTYTPKTLQPEELERLFGQLNDPYRAIAQVAYLTGARAREVLLLKTEQLRDALAIKVPTSHSNLTHPPIHYRDRDVIFPPIPYQSTDYVRWCK